MFTLISYICVAFVLPVLSTPIPVVFDNGLQLMPQNYYHYNPYHTQRSINNRFVPNFPLYAGVRHPNGGPVLFDHNYGFIPAPMGQPFPISHHPIGPHHVIQQTLNRHDMYGPGYGVGSGPGTYIHTNHWTPFNSGENAQPKPEPPVVVDDKMDKPNTDDSNENKEKDINEEEIQNKDQNKDEEREEKTEEDGEGGKEGDREGENEGNREVETEDNREWNTEEGDKEDDKVKV